MTLNGWLQILFFFLIILAVTKPLGVFMAHVFNREKTFLDPVLRPIERLIYKLTGVDEKREMRWTEYASLDALVQRGFDAGPLFDSARAGSPALEPATFAGCRRR